MIKAFELLNPTKTHLLIVGDGPLREGLEADVRKRGLGNIQFLGYLAKDRLLLVLAKAMATILPSECYENAPMSVIESFAMGKPVIGSRIGGITEIIDDGVNGYLFESGNAEDLQSKLELMIEKPAPEIEEMGRNARKKVEQEYNPELHYERLMGLYRKAKGLEL
jgi:glycosyltransferase involved in cell wall biosynthesis